jgi:hypothetical protein
MGATLAALLSTVSSSAATGSVVVPGVFEATEGGGGSSLLNNNIRLQEIHASSALPAGPILITEIRFRPSAVAGSAFTSTVPHLEIRLSTTPTQPPNLSSTFAANVGTNEVVVFDGELLLSSAFTGPAGGPKDFDILVPFTTPFAYNPREGNLLIDYRNYSGSSATYVDAGPVVNGQANRAFALGANATTGAWVDSGAEVLQLVYQVADAAPVIVTQPASQSVVLGGAATFHVTAFSVASPSYQWRFNGDELLGETNSSLTLSNVSAGSAGTYAVRVSNEFGTVVSDDATLTLTNPPPPLILAQPASQKVLRGGTATFSVTAVSPSVLTYQWQFNGVDLDGASGSVLTVTNVQTNNVGAYQVIVGSAFGSVTSAPALLELTDLVKVVVPPSLTGIEGGGGSSVLFDSIRLQEVYSSVYFSNAPIVITAVRFRPSALYGHAFAATNQDFQLNLSTTLTQPGHMSSRFADNLGSNDTVVFRGALPLSSEFAGPVGGPKAFDIEIPLQTPFSYDPAAGNLLLDVRNYIGSSVSAVDAGVPPDHLVSRVFALGANTAVGVGDGGADVIQVCSLASTAPPVIRFSPLSQHVVRSSEAVFTVGAAGGPPLVYQWFFGSDPLADATNATLLLPNVQSSQAGEYYVIVANGFGSATSQVATLTVDPSRTLRLTSLPPRQEGSAVSLLLELVSDGDVGGMTFVVGYDTNYLQAPAVNWSPLLGDLFNSVNTSAGQIRAAFALSGEAVPAGTQAVASIEFLLRSVPNDLDTALSLHVLDASTPDGNAISTGNLAEGSSIHVIQRTTLGDNNANDRLDVGDASIILRYLAQLEQPREWDVAGNDLNHNGSLDSGDAIKVLRTAAGIDPQPNTFAAASIAGNEVLPVEVMTLAPTNAQIGLNTAFSVQVRLANTRSAISGAAFMMDYPTNALRLVALQSLRLGALVPGNALAVWNVSPLQNNLVAQDGHIGFAVSSASPWQLSNGVLAELTFQVQPGATNRFSWPLTLRGCELTGNGYGNRFIVGNGARLIARSPLAAAFGTFNRDAKGVMGATLAGDDDATYVIEASPDLVHWTEVQSVHGGVRFTIPVGQEPNDSRHFYRARVSQE